MKQFELNIKLYLFMSLVSHEYFLEYFGIEICIEFQILCNICHDFFYNAFQDLELKKQISYYCSILVKEFFVPLRFCFSVLAAKTF